MIYLSFPPNRITAVTAVQRECGRKRTGCRYGASLALETFIKLVLGDRDGDEAIETRVAGLAHFAHAARTDGARIS